MSIEAINWVLDDAPDLPSNLVATLIALANHADRNGKAAAPSQKRIAAYTRKKPRTVRADLAALETLGLIRRGDQNHVAFLPADRRPVVYDLATERRSNPDPAPAAPTAGRADAADNPAHNRAAPCRRPAVHHPRPTPPGGGTPPPVHNSVTSTNPQREAVHRHRTINKEEETPPTSGPVDHAVELLLGLDDPWRIGQHTATALAPHITTALAAGWDIQALTAHLSANPDGVRSYTAVLRARLRDLPAPPRPRRVPQPPPRQKPPAWCGRCSPKSRMIASPVHAGKFVRCTECHTDNAIRDR
ncbi:helix-turn-helix domain-containing protein [Catellatospora sp. NPDC049111]|uniref:helix-turn-helix domain-containing protein n=1 Tax=Catellatospora sp. NPDC049111 TaxID=3155271 RepID=UPI0033EF4E8B